MITVNDDNAHFEGRNLYVKRKMEVVLTDECPIATKTGNDVALSSSPIQHKNNKFSCRGTTQPSNSA